MEKNTSTFEDSVKQIATHLQPDGNRIVAGTGGNTIDNYSITLDKKPQWLLAFQQDNKLNWLVVMEDGSSQVFQLIGGALVRIPDEYSSLPPAMPPVILSASNSMQLYEPKSNASLLTHAAFQPNGNTAFISNNGQLNITVEGQISIIEGDYLPDARILTDGAGRFLTLSKPSTLYTHGVLGDKLEATVITIIDADALSTSEIAIKDGDVIEGLSPIWVDLNADGSREIIVTQSNEQTGARIVVYNEDGSVLAESDPIGKKFRWLHQLAAAQFIPGGNLEIALVQTPHIGGILKILKLEGDKLINAAELPGYSTHSIGSRNLDTALAADLNGDGIVEILLPNQAHTSLHVVQWKDGNLVEVWSSDLGSALSTNLFAITLSDGKLAFGAGTAENHLLVWITR